jgi:hypothetical protein
VIHARLLLCVSTVWLCALAFSGAAAAQECPGAGLLLFDAAVYSEEPVPTGVVASRGDALGSGRLAFLSEDEACDPQEVEVVGLTGATPELAVAVSGRHDTIFVLGARCAGYEDEERARCILEPLTFDGRVYTGSRSPDGTEPTRLVAGEELGGAELGDESVTAVRLEGVDPSVAVGVDGRPGEAFVAAGSCPYERFAESEAEDDLVRCLQAPLWLIFELERPPAASSGEEVTARADRPVADVVDGARLSLALLDGAADVVPDDLSVAIDVGAIGVGPDGAVSVPITVPEVESGIYEAVLTCESCAEQFGGTTFPAGSLAIVGDSGGSGGPRLLGIVIGVLFFAAAILAVVAWRRGWWRIGFRRRGQKGEES